MTQRKNSEMIIRKGVVKTDKAPSYDEFKSEVKNEVTQNPLTDEKPQPKAKDKAEKETTESG